MKYCNKIYKILIVFYILKQLDNAIYKYIKIWYNQFIMNIKIKKNEEKPESVELLAHSIIQVAEGFEKVLNSSLNERALVVLLHDTIGAAKITKAQIKLVLEALPRLKSWYIKK